MDREYKEIGQLLNEKLNIWDVQWGFPLIPSTGEHDVILEETKNIGLLPYLKQMKLPTDLKQAGHIQNLKLTDHLPYRILELGKQLEHCESSQPVGEWKEVREITIVEKLNDGYTSNNNSTWSKPTSTLASIIHIPLLPDFNWRQFSTGLTRWVPGKKDEILNSLTKPNCHVPKSVPKALLEADRHNNEGWLSSEMYNKLRWKLNNLQNGAYVQSLIYGLTSYLSYNDLTCLFPRVYGIARAKEKHILKTDDQIGLVWKQIVVLQYLDNYYCDILSMHNPINLEMIMADLFQIVFGLDFAQHALGFNHGNLDVRTAIFYTKVDPCVYLQFRWHGNYYKVPTYGKLIKINDFKNSSIMINKVTQYANPKYYHKIAEDSGVNSSSPYQSACSASRNFESKIKRGKNEVEANKLLTPSFNTDLIRLGATLKKVLDEKKTAHVCDHPDIETTFWRMINNWIDCGNNNTGRVSMSEYRLKCLQEDECNIKCDTCTWRKFGDIPSHHICNKALPCDQQEYFAMFQVNEQDIIKDAQLYILD